MMELLLGPWVEGTWMMRATLSASLTAVGCGAVGVFVYLRRMSLVADALSHVALLGVVLAWLVTRSLDPVLMLISALGVGLLTTSLIGRLAATRLVRPDAAVGIVFTALFALAVVLLSMFVRDAHIDLQCVLYGNVLGVSDRALRLLALSTPLVLLLIAALWRPLVVGSFDPRWGLAVGLPVLVAHHGLMVATSVAAVAGFEAVGAILVVAMFILPAATAHQLARTMPGMMAIAVLHALASSVLGMYAAVGFEVYPGGAIVLAGGALYAAALLYASLLRARRPRAGAAVPSPSR